MTSALRSQSPISYLSPRDQPAERPTCGFGKSRCQGQLLAADSDQERQRIRNEFIGPPGGFLFDVEGRAGGNVVDYIRRGSPLFVALARGNLGGRFRKIPTIAEGGRKYPVEWLVRALLFRKVRSDLSSHHRLSSFLQANGDVSAAFGFTDGVPSREMFRNAWNSVAVDHERLENMAAKIATVAADEGYDRIDTSIIIEDMVNDTDATPSLLESEKDRSYRRIEDMLEDIIDFERAENASVPADDLVDVAGFLARRNTFAEQGVDRAAIENRTSVNAETYRRAVRNKERDKVRTRDEETVFLEPRDWSIHDANRERCDTSDWHGTLEEGIERLVELLKDEGVIDGPVPINIDGSKRLYHKHPEGADRAPDGVYQETRFPTDYAWKDMSVNAVINGRSIVLGNISRVPGDEFFRAVKYLIDRACELVDVECFYADAEYSNTDICRYIDRIGEEYVMKKSHRNRVRDELEQFTGDADYTEDFEMRSPRKGITHPTNLFGVEKRGQIGVKQGTKRDEETEQTGLEDFGANTGQLTFEDIADRENDTEFVAFVTNRDIEGVGIDPDKNPIGHDSSNTVWGAAEDYRGRWSIETTFRQVKYQFLAKTTSRDLGVRRFYWMLAILLYNSWATLNLMIQRSVPTVSDDRPPVRAKVFLETLAARSWPPPG